VQFIQELASESEMFFGQYRIQVRDLVLALFEDGSVT
jgi:hypothetical protein